MHSYLILAGILAFTVFGDYALKYASTMSTPMLSSWFVGGAALYAVSAVGWLLLMQTHNLAEIAVLYSAATILALTAVGYFFFGENVSFRQVLGLSAALLSVFLMQAEA